MALGASARITGWLNRAYSEEELSWREVNASEPEEPMALPLLCRVCVHHVPLCTVGPARKGRMKILR